VPSPALEATGRAGLVSLFIGHRVARLAALPEWVLRQCPVRWFGEEKTRQATEIWRDGSAMCVCADQPGCCDGGIEDRVDGSTMAAGVRLEVLFDWMWV
jgi:hypothetical protein